MKFKQILKTINYLQTFEELHNFLKNIDNHYESGTSRKVYLHRDSRYGTTVIKFDIDNGRQNKNEIDTYKSSKSKLLCPIIDYDKESYLYKTYGKPIWLQMPYARKITYKQYRKFDNDNTILGRIKRSTFKNKYSDIHSGNVRMYKNKFVIIDYGYFK